MADTVLVNVTTRNDIVETNRGNLTSIMAEHEIHQSEELSDAIIDCSQIGIWSKLNEYYFDRIQDPHESIIVFTGQQPTIDYSLHRRLAKSIDVPDDMQLLVHTHADHDSAKKKGFGYIEFPVINEKGVFEVKKYNLVKENGSELMSDTHVPTNEEISNFFDELQTDLARIIESYSQTNLVRPEANTQILTDCKNFILSNLSDIRSGAELNAAIQSFVLRQIIPEGRSVEIMLSDLIETNLFRKALAEQLLEMPKWIDFYNIANRHIHNTSYNEIGELPKELEVLTNEHSTLKEVPLWISYSENGGTKKRHKAYILDDGSSNYQVGVFKNDVFQAVLEFNKDTQSEDLLNLDVFELFSPGAVTLVDILRSRLRIPAVHGKTGFYYEAINELAKMLQMGIITQEDLGHNLVINPNLTVDMTPISAAYTDPKSMPFLNEAETKAHVAKIENEIEIVNQQLDDNKFVRTLLFKIFSKTEGLDGSKVGPNLVAAINTVSPKEYKVLSKKEVGKEIISIIKDNLDIYSQSSEDLLSNYIDIIKQNGNTEIVDFINKNTKWFVESIKLMKNNLEKEQLQKNLSTLETQKIQLENFVSGNNDYPLLIEAVFRPGRIKAVSRLVNQIFLRES